MIASLLGVPGKLKTLLGRLTATRAGLLDNLDAAMTTRAPASTALSTDTWTGSLAAYLGVASRRKPVASIVNAHSGGGSYYLSPMGGATPYSDILKSGLKFDLSGSLTANTLKTMVNLTGSGVFRFLALRVENGTSRSIRIKVTVDSVVVFDSTSAVHVFSANSAMAVIGSWVWNATYGGPVSFGCIEYDSSFKVEIASSATETDALGLLSCYETRA